MATIPMHWKIHG